MAQYRVKRLLNKRKHPVVDFEDKRNVVGTVDVGTIIESVGEIDTVNGKWVWDKGGIHYWGGGFEEIRNGDENIFKFKIPPRINPELIKSSSLKWWHTDFKIPDIWREFKTLGFGVKIAILDTGYKQKITLGNYENITGWNFINNNSDIEDNDGHGTEVTSIISSNNDKLIGIAPESSIFMCKCVDSVTDIMSFINTLNKLADCHDIDIITLTSSYAEDNINSQPYKDRYQAAITKNRDKLIFNSVGNLNNRVQQKSMFPSSFKEVIGVGSISQNGMISNLSTKTDSVDLVAPGDGINVLTKSNFIVEEVGTSFSTPYVAGVAALMISFARQEKPGIPINTLNIKDILFKSIPPLEIKSDLYGYGRINPSEAMKLLRQKLNNL